LSDLKISSNSSLSHRERFIRTFQYRKVDRLPLYELGYWRATLNRWYEEGLPADFKKKSIEKLQSYFGLEGFGAGPYIQWLPLNTSMWPPFRERIIRKEDNKFLAEDGMGGIYVTTFDGGETGNRYLRYPINNRNDWEKLKPFFNPDTPGRIPSDWDEHAKKSRLNENPVGINIGSLYGWIHNWIGFKNISIAFHSNPEWIADMMDTLVELWISLIRKTLRNTRVDFAGWWEDMCYNHGPFISPKHFEEFMVPRYKQVTDTLKEYGVNLNILDCDGKIAYLIPGWLKAGINCLFPLEAKCNNPYILRETFGKKILFIGGIDKNSLVEGKKSIDKELDRLTPLLKQGGYIPMVDHLVPPEVSLPTFRYYLKKKNEWIYDNNP
jgi:uroporphyrinogen decarboxylase